MPEPRRAGPWGLGTPACLQCLPGGWLRGGHPDTWTWVPGTPGLEASALSQGDRAPSGLPPAEVRVRPPGFRVGPASLLPRVPRRDHPEAPAQAPWYPRVLSLRSSGSIVCPVHLPRASLFPPDCPQGSGGGGHTAHDSAQPFWAPLGGLVGGAAQTLSGAWPPLSIPVPRVAPALGGLRTPRDTTCPPHAPRASLLLVGRPCPGNSGPRPDRLLAPALGGDPPRADLLVSPA